MTLAWRSTTNSGSSLSMLSIHRNLRQFLSSGSTEIFKNAFLISLASPILFSRKRIKISNMVGVSGGPTFKQSFKDGEFLSGLLLASKTTLSLVDGALIFF